MILPESRLRKATSDVQSSSAEKVLELLELDSLAGWLERSVTPGAGRTRTGSFPGGGEEKYLQAQTAAATTPTPATVPPMISLCSAL